MLLIVSAYGHSFLSCSNFVQNGSKYYCKGFPRDYEDLLMNGGEEYAYYLNPNEPPCSAGQTSTAYSSQYPMAQAKPGDKMTITWPSNTHDVGNDAVTPVYLYWTKQSGSEAETIAEWKINEFATLNFSNCLAGNVLCSGNITIPSVNFGNYSFLFFWNNYTTCFDYNINENPVNSAESEIDILKLPGSDMGDMDMGGSAENKKSSSNFISFSAVFVLITTSTLVCS